MNVVRLRSSQAAHGRSRIEQMMFHSTFVHKDQPYRADMQVFSASYMEPSAFKIVGQDSSLKAMSEDLRFKVFGFGSA